MCALSYRIRKRMKQESDDLFQKGVEYGKLEDLSYALDTDQDLTAEQKAEVDAFWGKYKFVADMGYNAWKTYYNRSGIWDPRYVPYYFLKKFIRPSTAPENYIFAFQNKAYLPKLLANAKQPMTIVRRVEGIYYNTRFEKITQDEALDLALARLQEREIVVKPSGLAGGKGVEFFREATREELAEVFENKGDLFVVQDAIHQHPEMARLNDSTVNTVRLTTLMLDGKFIPLAALVKVGSPKVRVDNYKHGGCLIGVNLDGTAFPWALNVKRERVTVLPSGVDLAAGDFKVVPCFDSVLKTAEKAHYDIPIMKLISWDIAIDDEGEAEIIEANFGGDVRMHQVLTGPIFGDLTEEVLDAYCLKDGFSKDGLTKDYDYQEFYDHVVITRYLGREKEVTVPPRIAGKPVEGIAASAFEYNERVEKIQLPKKIRFIGKHAFFGCTNLTEIKFFKKNMEVVDPTSVNRCPNLPAQNKKRLRHAGSPK
ncbi:MAG: sugar-transfer associated ATP-grasp domain-containing protein [Anaerovoracaceae bacterium]